MWGLRRSDEFLQVKNKMGMFYKPAVKKEIGKIIFFFIGFRIRENFL